MRGNGASDAAAMAWLCPPAASLAALAGKPRPGPWLLDGPLLAHLARFSRTPWTPTTDPFSPRRLADPRLLTAAAHALHLSAPAQPPEALPPALAERAWSATRLAAKLAEAERVAPAGLAAAATRLTFLGWDALNVANPAAVTRCWAEPSHDFDPVATQTHHFGRDAGSLARRLARAWDFPDWLTALLGTLRLSVSDAVAAGAPRGLARVVRVALAVTAARLGPTGHALLPAEPSAELERGFALFRPVAVPDTEPSPSDAELLTRLLTRTAELRTSQAGRLAEHLDLAEQNVDRLTRQLAGLRRDFTLKLRDDKLSGLAEFAAGASHEINNPLAVISGHAQLLLAEKPDPEAAGRLRSIVRQTRRIHDILQGTRHFARPPSLRRGVVEVGALIVAAVKPHEADAAAKGVRLELPRALGLEPLWADETHLTTALAHLVRNAVEAAPAGGWVRVGVAESHGGTCFAVEDSGSGPEPEQWPHLFDPFFSGRSAGRGRGLGLPIAWSLAKLHGGDVRYEPAPGHPSRFVLSVPRCAEAALRRSA